MSDPLRLAVLWEDPHGLAVAKPAGLLTQGPPEGEITLEALVRRHLRPDDPASVYLGTVHRLDRPVSGVVLWAKTPKAARRWAEQFAGRSARKEYWAIVEMGAEAGRLASFGTWDDRLAPPDASGRARVVEADRPGLARALTRFEVGSGMVAPEGLTWLKLRPETGRTHQLRVQAAARGWPIVGDTTYGATRGFPIGIALHARGLEVEHPIARRPILVEAPLPASWAGWLTVSRVV
jgi:23S rRNA pseudouridine1911/1915/1917 synthase